ncbi:unnamed protein product [Colias eurytheme]|nr:unnamed protein product [Colias eurytheme]
MGAARSTGALLQLNESLTKYRLSYLHFHNKTTKHLGITRLKTSVQRRGPLLLAQNCKVWDEKGRRVVRSQADVLVSFVGQVVDGGGGRSGKPGARSARARAPLTSATARRRAAQLTTVTQQLLFYIHERERRETKDSGGARAVYTRRRSDARRHLAANPATTRAYSFRSADDRNKSWSRRGYNTVTDQGAVIIERSQARIVPWSERGCVWWWRSDGPCCQAARERRGPGMAGSCSTLRCGRCGRPRRALHATGPRTARARDRCARTPALATPHRAFSLPRPAAACTGTTPPTQQHTLSIDCRRYSFLHLKIAVHLR